MIEFLPPLATPAVPPALVIVPPEIVHTYVIPERAVTDADDEVPDVIEDAASVMVGVTGWVTVPVTEIDALPGALVVPAAFVSVAESVSVPAEPEVKVTVLTPLLVTPLVELVMVPSVIDHA